MAVNYDLENTGQEVQQRLDQVMPNWESIQEEVTNREEADLAVRRDMVNYTDAETERAETAEGELREHIDESIATLEGKTVSYEEQEPTAEEQEQARENLGVYSKERVDQIASAFTEQKYVSVRAVTTTTSANVAALINATGHGEQTDTIYRVGSFDGTAYDAEKYTEYTWNGSEYVIMAVRSSLGESGGTFDISVYNADGGVSKVYDNLTQALADVPQEMQSDGMSVKFIENVYAEYSVVVTGGLYTQPEGTLLENAPSVTSGTYEASELTDFAILPANPYNSLTYYVVLIDNETTTYTSWVITKKTNDSTEYVQARLLSPIWSADVNDWQVDMMHELVEQAGQTEIINIPFDGGNYYINEGGTVTHNNNWRITKPIAVNENDEFHYTGSAGSVSIPVAAYKFNGETYEFVAGLIPRSSSLWNDTIVLIPAGITHIRATVQSSAISTSSLRRIVNSTLSRLNSDLEGVSYKKTFIGSSYTRGHYVDYNGGWNASNSALYLFLDVSVGDVVTLYDFKAVTNIATLSKKVTDTLFLPLVIREVGSYDLLRYIATENMTLCISGYAPPRITSVYGNKINIIGGVSSLLNATREEIDVKNNELAIYDLRFGYMFNNIAVIGDSMSVGSISTESSLAPNNNMGASWLSVLAKRWGCISRMHYAQGGASCQSWLNSTVYGLGLMLNDQNVYNAYLIAYGHNDSPSAGVGAATDTAAPIAIEGGVPSCPDGYTFCAYYKAVVNQVRQKAPHAIIFCLSEYDNVVKTKNNGTYRQAIIDVANWFYEQGDHLVFHLETGGVPDSQMSLGSHYSTQGYFHIARQVDFEANKAIYERRGDIDVKEFGVYNNTDTRYEEYQVEYS